MTGPTEAIRTCLAKSFQFKGRATRSEFWWFALVVVISSTMILTMGAPHNDAHSAIRPLFLAMYLIPLLSASLLLSVGIRRTRDAGLPPMVYLAPVTTGMLLLLAGFIFTYESLWTALALLLLPICSLVLLLLCALPSRAPITPHRPNPNEVPQ